MRTFPARKRLAGTFLSFVFLAGIAFAQSSKIQVIVTDENGVAVPGAQISLTDRGGVPIVKGETDFAGRAQLADVPAGAYQLKVEKQGFYALAQKGVRVEPGATIDATLTNLQEVKEEVDVVESPPQIDPAKTANTESLSGLDVVNIPYPTTRDYRNVLPFIPGVVQDASGQPHVGGGYTYQTLDVLDGFDISDPVSGLLRLRVSTDAIRSIDVQSSRYSAQYGRASAGVIDLHTGIGDNHFRYSATNFIPSAKVVQGVHLDKWAPRASFSGPLRKNKTWFFDGWDGEFDQNIVRGLPRGANNAPLWRFSNLAKLQHNVTRENILTGSFLFNRFKFSNVGLSLFNPEAATFSEDQTGYFATLKDQHYFKGGALLEAGIALNELEADDTPKGSLPFIVHPNGPTGNFYRQNDSRAHRIQWITNLYLPPMKWHGNHEIKIGTDADRVAYHQFIVRRPIRIERIDGTLDRLVEFPNGILSFQKSNLQASTYAQDRWSPTERLLFETGLRFDWDQIVRNVLVSPRFSSTYLLSNKTKFSAGVGLFYDATNLDLITRPLQGQRVDFLFEGDGVTLRAPPVRTLFVVNQSTLQAPRFLNWSLGLEQELPGSVYFRAEFMDRRGTRGFVYVPQGPSFNGEFLMTNDKQDHYHSLQLTVRHTFRKTYPVFAAYTRSSAKTNAVLDYNVDTLAFVQQGPGPLPWDTPNRFISWGLLPTFSFPIFHKFDFAYSMEWRTGYPFSAVNQNQQLVFPLEGFRFPSFFSFNPHLEKRFHLWGYSWAVRGGFENVTNHSNPGVVNNNIDSPLFRTFSNFDRRTFTARVRFLGRKK